MNRPQPISVLLATEGTYPFYTGGVSTWCHRLTHGLPYINFDVLAVVTNPFQQPKYELAPNVQEVVKVPQWGLLQPAEYSRHQPTSVVLRNLWETTPQIIASRFQPLFERFLALLVSAKCDKEELGQLLLDLQSYFQRYDYQTTMNSVEAWNVLQHALRAAWEERPSGTTHPTLAEVKQVYRLLYHLLMILHVPVPRADLTHASAASFCGLPCVLSKLAFGTPYLLTEHGVYLREQYLNLRRQIKSFFVRWFLYRLVENVVELNYYFADQISPVCSYNARWERRLGVPENHIKIIFNGVSPEKFQPAEHEPGDRPIVSVLGLIYQLKGQLDMIDATALIKASVPEVEVRFYGEASDPKYFSDCKNKVTQLGVESSVCFAGATKTPWKVYGDADVMAFPSVSEGFPYVVLESMFCGSAIVATDVGGVREALGDCGLIVPPRKPAAMAEAVTFLLRNPERRKELGRMAHQRAMENFTEAQFLNSYGNTYRDLLASRSRLAVLA